jgi:hypothetical protein
MSPHKLEYRSAGQRKVHQPGELASAIVGITIFAMAFLFGCTLLIGAPSDSSKPELWTLFLIFAIITAFGIWRFASRIWRLCRRDEG